MPKTIEEVVRERGFHAFKPKGTSMFPLLREGYDVYVVKPVFPLKKYDVPVYKRADGTYVMHRVLDTDADGYVCCGDNQWVLEHGVTEDMIVGVLDSWYKGKKKHTVRDKSYRRYVRFWCRSLGRRRRMLCVIRKWYGVRGFLGGVRRKLFGKKKK